MFLCPCFNSSKVRLKAINIAVGLDSLLPFQFLKGSIKSNSRTARLSAISTGFNSSKVRLKGDAVLQRAGMYAEFQFLKGSIKS